MAISGYWESLLLTLLVGIGISAISIARAAKRLKYLRERWLNPPEWTERVAEVIPLGMDKNPYPDRVLPRANLGAAERAELKERTLTNLYNQRPAWLTDAHAALDAAVAAACGWTDDFAATTDNEILARLVALNLERAASNKNAAKQLSAFWLNDVFSGHISLFRHKLLYGAL